MITVEIHATNQTALTVCKAAPFKGLDIDVTREGLILKVTTPEEAPKRKTPDECLPLTMEELARVFRLIDLLGG